MADEASDHAQPPSLARTGLRASAAYARSALVGVAFAVVVAGGALLAFWSRVPWSTLTGAQAAVGAALVLFVPVYVVVGLHRARTRALAVLAAGHGDRVADGLASAIAAQADAMPGTRSALARASGAISVDALAARVAPVLGQGKLVRHLIARIVDRLPLTDLLGRPPEEPLQPVLAQRIQGVLQSFATPSRTMLWAALAAHAAVFGGGWWLTR